MIFHNIEKKTEKQRSKSIRKAAPNDDSFSKMRKTGKDMRRGKIAAHRGKNTQKHTQIHTLKCWFEGVEEFVE